MEISWEFVSVSWQICDFSLYTMILCLYYKSFYANIRLWSLNCKRLSGYVEYWAQLYSKSETHDTFITYFSSFCKKQNWWSIEEGNITNNVRDLFLVTKLMNEWMNESSTFQHIYIFTCEINILYIRHCYRVHLGILLRFAWYSDTQGGKKFWI